MPDRRIDRRTFIRGGVAAGGALLGGSAMAAVAKEVASSPAPARRPPEQPHRQPPPSTSEQALAPAVPHRPAGPGTRPGGPNILVIVVDQLRTPQWFTASPVLARMLPNISRLRREGVSFERHYTASND